MGSTDYSHELCHAAMTTSRYPHLLAPGVNARHAHVRSRFLREGGKRQYKQKWQEGAHMHKLSLRESLATDKRCTPVPDMSLRNDFP